MKISLPDWAESTPCGKFVITPQGVSVPEGIPHLEQQLIRLTPPAFGDRLRQVVIVNNKQITVRRKGPAQSRIGADGIAFIIVLYETAELQIR